MKVAVAALAGHILAAIITVSAAQYYLDTSSRPRGDWSLAATFLMLCFPLGYACVLIASWMYPLMSKQIEGRVLAAYLSINTLITCVGMVTSGWSFVVIAFHLLPRFS